MILDAKTSDHDAAQAKCQQYGAMLPEPRNEKEHQFLSNLCSTMFALGIRKTGNRTGHKWFWESDGSPVVFNQWHESQPYNDSNCAMTAMPFWYYVPCDDSLADSSIFFTHLVCQSKIGMCIFNSFRAKLFPRFCQVSL